MHYSPVYYLKTENNTISLKKKVGAYLYHKKILYVNIWGNRTVKFPRIVGTHVHTVDDKQPYQTI